MLYNLAVNLVWGQTQMSVASTYSVAILELIMYFLDFPFILFFLSFLS